METWEKKLLQKIRQAIGRPDDRTNFQDLEDMIGIPDAVNSNLDDIIRTGFDSTITTANEDGSVLERLEQIQEATNVGSGTSLGADKSLVDALGTNGLTHTWGYDASSVLGTIDGEHLCAHLLFIIPEAVAAINAHNAAILVDLQRLAEVATITQGDALSYPDFNNQNAIICGTDNGTVWVTTNLAHVKQFSGPVVCVDSTVAAYLEIGIDGGDAAVVTAINAIANIEASFLGVGVHGFTGLAAGANTVAAAGTTFNTLDMSDADLTETWFAYESVNANTDVTIGIVYKRQPDGSSGTDEDGLEIPASRFYYGCGYSYNALNSLGQNVLSLLTLIAIHGTKSGSTITITGGIGTLQSKIFGNQQAQFAATTPLVEFIAGQNTLGTRLAAGKSLVDALGTDGTTVTDSAVTVLGAIGANNANNTFDSSTVAENGDGSVLERLEEIRGKTDITGSPFTLTAAMTTVEQTVVNYTPTKNGRIAALFDLQTLVADSYVGTITIRLKYMIDGVSLRETDRADFLVGTDSSFPTVSGFVTEGASFVSLTIQANVAVDDVPAKTIPFRIIESS